MYGERSGDARDVARASFERASDATRARAVRRARVDVNVDVAFVPARGRVARGHGGDGGGARG